MKQRFFKFYLVFLLIVWAGLLATVFLRAPFLRLFATPSVLVSLDTKQPQESERKEDLTIEKDNEKMFTQDALLYSYVKKFGPKETVRHLNELAATYGSCHDAAHKAGRFSYELFGEESFKECGSECHSGCYHGATEAYFKDHGTANLSQNLNVICNSELNTFFSHQCIHGIGHGLMAWTNYDLPEALKSCDLLSNRKDSCWTGVFMENIVGGLVRGSVDAEKSQTGHFTKYLSDDPHYPCTTVDGKYKGSCYFLQTSRMIQLFGANFSKIAASCAEAPKLYQQSCFGSMGRDAGGTHRKDPKGAIAACAHIVQPDGRLWCLNGAAQDSFWDPTGQDDALAFCGLLSNTSEKESCYETIFSRAPEVFTSRSEHSAFCQKAEKEYRDKCVTFISQ